MLNKLLFGIGKRFIRLSGIRIPMKTIVFGGLVQDEEFDSGLIEYHNVDYDLTEDGICPSCHEELGFSEIGVGSKELCPLCNEQLYP